MKLTVRFFKFEAGVIKTREFTRMELGEEVSKVNLVYFNVKL